MKLPFYKFHGNGNDFIIVDHMSTTISLTADQIKKLCHRRFGIGADGLIEIYPSASHDFVMKYYNADGLEGTMCGNGGRCVSAFAFMKNYTDKSTSFEAVDGLHRAIVESVLSPENEWYISLQMQDVTQIAFEGTDFFINTGSPHLVRFVDDVHRLDVHKTGKQIRNSFRTELGGVNVNFVQSTQQGIYVRTYERGVEDETLSCGTGVTASAIAAGIKFGKNKWKVETRGGLFTVDYNEESWGKSQVWLRGPAAMICMGEVYVTDEPGNIKAI